MTNLVSKGRFWQEYAQFWHQVRPPLRPDQEDIRLYNLFLQKTIGKLKRPQILILGATPELRDLASHYPATVTVLDYSLEMIIAMTRLMRKENPAEVWMKGDWVDAPLRKNHYEAILGDGVYNNVAPEKARAWWLHLRALLTPRGALVTRIGMMISQNAQQNLVAQILKTMAGKKIDNKAQLSALYLVAQLASYDSGRKVARSVNQHVFNKAVGFAQIPATQRQKFYQALVQVYPVIKKEWRYAFSEQAEREIQKYFKIKAVLKNKKSPFADVLPIYFLKK